MNRKNLTAAVLAGLAGVAGMAGAAQAGHSGAAVNLNPDGLGEVLIYPYYTTNDDNTTLVTVVNTTGSAKAVKVRFLEGFNSREVLDFNLYLSKYDVWVAAVADSAAFGAEAGVAHLFTPDTSCTVPYLYGDFYNEDLGGGLHPFLPYAYSGDNNDGGPDEESSYDSAGNITGPIPRASEGYIEIIEMGEMLGNDARKDTNGKTVRIDSETAVTHVVKTDEDGNKYDAPANCALLVENWTAYTGSATKPDIWAGWWLTDALFGCDLDDGPFVGESGCGENDGTSTAGAKVASLGHNTGGLFGGAAIINVPNGTMFSYDAKALQGFDESNDGNHFYPGTIHPSLNDGDVADAIVFIGQGFTAPVSFVNDDNDATLDRSVDAVSAVFMHDTLANTFVIEEEIAAATEWVMTLPTKSWYTDTNLTGLVSTYWEPNPSDPGCLGWKAGDTNPFAGWEKGDTYPAGWLNCDPVEKVATDAYAPFSEPFDGESCDEVTFENWNREESPTVPGGSVIPPIVSPAPPGPPGSKKTPFELCYEVNVLRFGEGSVFGGDLIADGGLVYTVSKTQKSGWAQITMDGELEDDYGTVLGGLPITGFSAEQYTNGELEGGVLANYGGLFSHKGSVCIFDGKDEDADCDSGYTNGW